MAITYDAPVAAPASRRVAYDDAPPAAPAAPTPALPAPAAPIQRSGLEHARAVLDTLLSHPMTALPGLIENGVAGATGGVGSVIEALTGKDPGTVDTAYRPRTEAGREIAELGGEEAGHIGEGYDKVAGTGPLAQTIKERGPQALNAVGTIVGARAGVKGVTGLADDAARVGTVEGAARTDAGSIVERGRALGYKFRPSDVRAAEPANGKPTGLKREGLAQPNDLRRDTTIDNQVVTTRATAEDIGAKKTDKITPEDFDKLREDPLNVYRETGEAAGKFDTSPDFHSALDAISTRDGLTPKGRRAIQQQVDQYRADNLSGPDAVKRVSALRRRATMELRSDDVATNDAGMANRAIADAYEAEIGRQLTATGQAAQLPKFQTARTQLAKLHDVQSVTKGGQVDAHGLARLKARGVPLSGNLDTIATVAESPLKNVVRHSSKATGVGNSVKADSIYGAVKNVAKEGLRKIPGMDVMSDRFQSRNFGREASPTERSYSADAGKKPPPAGPNGVPAQLGAGNVDYTPTPGTVPSLAEALSGDLRLAPEPVQNPVELPAAPDRLTADVPPATPSGGLPFTADTNLAAELSGELPLAPRVGGSILPEELALAGERGAPGPDSIDWVPPNLAEMLTGGLRADMTPPAYTGQAELPVWTQQPSLMTPAQTPVPFGPRVQLEAPPGRVGKPKRK